MERQQISLGKHFWGRGVSLITLLVGGWLMIAPYALGYQSYGSSWLAQTKNDFWTGLAVVILSLLSLALIAVSLIADLRTAGVIQERQKPEPLPEAETVPEQAAAQDDFERAMTRLASVLAEDLAVKHQKDSERAVSETLINSDIRR